MGPVWHLDFLYLGLNSVYSPPVAPWLAGVFPIKDWAQSALSVMGCEQLVHCLSVEVLCYLPLFPNCLWSDSLFTIGSWFGILMSF